MRSLLDTGVKETFKIVTFDQCFHNRVQLYKLVLLSPLL